MHAEKIKEVQMYVLYVVKYNICMMYYAVIWT